MGRKKNMSQMKQQEESPSSGLNEMNTSKIPDKEFETIATRTLRKPSENFNSLKKDKETIKKEPVRNEGYNN